jgi:hypothetical protein
MSQEDAGEGQEPNPKLDESGQKPPPPPEGTTPETGKTFDEAYVKTLRAEAAANRKAAQEAAAKVEEFESRDKSEVEKLTGKVEREKSRADAAESRLLKFQVAAEKQIPAEAMDLLTGSDREELEANADKLLALSKGGAKTPDFDGGVRETPPEEVTPEQAHAKILGDLFRSPQ